jgi:N-acetylmuramoyl-L-alanine amidase
MAKIVLDPGHGVNTPGKRSGVIARYGRVVKEYEANKLYAGYLKEELERQGHTIVWTGGDHDPSLSTRVNEANASKADIFISCHWNAGGGTGTETYVYQRGGKAEKLAKEVHSRLISAMGFADRGVKTANFYVIKYTNMPAILIEYGFMDSPNDHDQRYMLDHDKAKAAAIAVAKGVQAYFGLSYKGGSAEQPPQKEIEYVEDNHIPIQLGSKGDLVKQVQAWLNEKADGYFGPTTKKAVEDWQRAHDADGKPGHGLPVTGIVDYATWRALNIAKTGKDPYAKYEPPYRVVVDGKEVVWSAYDSKILGAVEAALKDNSAKEIVITRIDK